MRNKIKKDASFAKSKSVKGSVQKLNLVADIVRGMKTSEALLQLQFCKRKLAQDIGAVLQSAIANAENNYNLDIDTLYISEILVGKSFTLKRMHPRARGRAGAIKKPFSNVTVYVESREGA